MAVAFDFSGRVVLVTGASGALGSAVVEAFQGTGATVCGADVRTPDHDDALLEPAGVDFYEVDLTDEPAVEETIGAIADRHGRLDALCNIAGTWLGGQPIDETPLEEFDRLLAINLRTMFLASKHAIPLLEADDGAIVSVAARSSLRGGVGDGPYRAAKAGVRLLTETIAEENLGAVRANAVMPSVIDTPMNREMMPDADHAAWVDPGDIARMILFLCSDAAAVTSGAAVPVYGEA